MALATYQDVEKVYFGASTDTFSASQQPIVTALIAQVEAEVMNILGVTSTPTDSNNALKSIIAQITSIILRNADNKNNPNWQWVNPYSKGMVERIKATAKDEDDDTDEICALGLIRDYENYYGY